MTGLAIVASAGMAATIGVYVWGIRHRWAPRRLRRLATISGGASGAVGLVALPLAAKLTPSPEVFVGALVAGGAIGLTAFGVIYHWIKPSRKEGP